MEKFIDKIASYNIFNFFFPGVIFSVLTDHYTNTSLVQEHLIEGAFLYYFIGLSISRFGSLVIGPLLKKTGFIKFKPYEEFIKACNKDEKIELFSEINNTFRTLATTFFILFLFLLMNNFFIKPSAIQNLSSYIIVLTLLVLFLFSHRKQTNYINKRIELAI